MRRRPPVRRAALLMEVLISLALFIGAAAFTIGVTRSVLTSMDRAGRTALAADLARAKMAELEAGLVTLSDLRDGEAAFDQIGSVDLAASAETFDGAASGPRWSLEIEVERTEYTGLSLITLTVSEVTDLGTFAPSAVDGSGVSFTLRQVLPIRDEETDWYEEDELLEGLEASR